jgi:hypothetical protein
MARSLPTRFSCYTLRPDQLVTIQGIEVLRLASGHRGVPLARSGKARLGVHLSEHEHDLDERSQIVRTGWLSEHNVVCPEDETSPRQILLRVSGVRDVQLLQGQGGITVAVHSIQCHLTADDPVYAPQRKPANAVLGFHYEDYQRPHHFPAVRLETRGRRPIVVGLTSHERDSHGQPILWVSDEVDYGRRIQSASRALEHQLLRWTK